MTIDVICDRECPSPKTVHCLGTLTDKGWAKCWHCGRFMPLDVAIDFQPGDEMWS